MRISIFLAVSLLLIISNQAFKRFPSKRYISLNVLDNSSQDPPNIPSDESAAPKGSSPDKNKSLQFVVLNKWNELSQETKEDIKSSVTAFFIALFVRLFLFEPRFIPSLSMFPTFDIGDQLLVDKISKINRPYNRRDVVVFNPSDRYTELTGNTEALIKRIVAVEGDTVEVREDHKLYVNGIQQDEPYINEDPAYSLKLMKVPPGMLLVLGDNRNHSFDGHSWGFLPVKNVIGRAVVKYWPPWRVGWVEGTSF